MSLLLNIDTATEFASACFSEDENILAFEKNTDQKNHASFIQPAIKKLTNATGIALSDIDAVGITAGPGSYTGLRVGLATAKGLCYALQKPLILVNTLEVMAFASIQETGNLQPRTGNQLFCPMIDARRMEVFTAIYDNNLNNIFPPSAIIVGETTFAEYLDKTAIIFSGTGHNKFKNIVHHVNAIFQFVQHNATHLAILSAKAFEKKQFADTAYSEPYYLKEFFTAFQPQQMKKLL